MPLTQQQFDQFSELERTGQLDERQLELFNRLKPAQEEVAQAQPLQETQPLQPQQSKQQRLQEMLQNRTEPLNERQQSLLDSINQFEGEKQGRIDARIARRERAEEIENLGTAEILFHSFRKGVGDVERGIRIPFNRLFGDEEEALELEAIGKADEAAIKDIEERHGLAVGVGEALGKAALSIPIALKIPATIVSTVAAAVGLGGLEEGLAKIGQGGTLEEAQLAAGIGAVTGGVVALGFGAFIKLVSGVGRHFLTTNIPGKEKSIKDFMTKASDGKFFTPDGKITKAGQEVVDDFELGIDEKALRGIVRDIGDTEQLGKLTPAAAARTLRAEQALKADISGGQASGATAARREESALRGAEGETAKQAAELGDLQAAAISTAKNDFLEPFKTGIDPTRSGRGDTIKKALTQINTQARDAVSGLYERLSKMPGANNRLNLLGLSDQFRQIARDRDVPREFINKIDDLFAEFGIPGAKTLDAENVSLLTMGNAHKVIKRLNKLYGQDATKNLVLNELKSGFDDALLVALNNQPRGVAGRAIRAAANEAREAAKQRFRTFRNKDIVQELTSFKNGSTTDTIDPSMVLENILGPGNRLENIRRIKNALTTGKGVNKGAALNAWNEIKSQALDDMFEGVIKTGKNGELIIDGAALQTARNNFGDKEIRALFGTGKQMRLLNSMFQSIGDVSHVLPKTGKIDPNVKQIAQGTGALFANITQAGLGFTSRIISGFGKAAESFARQQKDSQILKSMESGRPITDDQARIIINFIAKRLGQSAGLIGAAGGEDTLGGALDIAEGSIEQLGELAAPAQEQGVQ